MSQQPHSTSDNDLSQRVNPQPISSHGTVSVIIPTFNRDRETCVAIQSALNQTYRDIEIIVVDDGSTPPFELSPEMKQCGITIVRHPYNKGASAARNTGATNAAGKYISWLDSDDVWEDNKLSAQIEKYVSASEGGANTFLAVSCGFSYKLPNNIISDRRIPIPAYSAEPFFSGCWFCPGSTILLEKATFWEVGGYDENVLRLEDVDWFARFGGQGGRMVVVEDYLALITIGHPAGYNKVRMSGDYLIRKYRDENVEWNLLRRLSAYFQIEFAKSAIACDGRVVLGSIHLLRSLVMFPRFRLHLKRFWK